jgi:hypothetical protein
MIDPTTVWPSGILGRLFMMMWLPFRYANGITHRDPHQHPVPKMIEQVHPGGPTSAMMILLRDLERCFQDARELMKTDPTIFADLSLHMAELALLGRLQQAPIDLVSSCVHARIGFANAMEAGQGPVRLTHIRHESSIMSGPLGFVAAISSLCDFRRRAGDGMPANVSADLSRGQCSIKAEFISGGQFPEGTDHQLEMTLETLTHLGAHWVKKPYHIDRHGILSLEFRLDNMARMA